MNGTKQYNLILDDAFWQAIKLDESPILRPNVRGLDALRRYRVTSPKTWPLKHTSYDVSTYMYYSAICSLGQNNVVHALYALFHYAGKVSRESKFAGMEDDCVRQILKKASSFSFEQYYGSSPAYIFLMHLHALGGKCPYSKEEVISDLRDWVSPKQSLCPDKGFEEEYFQHLRASWKYNTDASDFMDFEDYCNDIIRWGTSGGGPKSSLEGETYRTKWAWGLSRVMDKNGCFRDGVSIYREAMKEKQHCDVALKEETTKTRAVITTPMASYLRQSYLVYRAGDPDINSPITNSDFINNFESQTFSWYGCIDGDKFDHSIPMDIIIRILRLLGSFDDRSYLVAEMEIEHIRNLVIKWGDTTIKYEGGLLSGWRLTSLIGTIISDFVGRYVVRSYGLAAQVAALGDDLILYSNTTSITREELVESYNQFGLKANLRKTTSGCRGEFLRKSYTPWGILGYPALGLRTVIYADPWINAYSYEFDEEISNGWLTFYSRMLIHAVDASSFTHWTQEHMITDIFNSSKLDRHSKTRDKIFEWVQTPMSAGGGGPMEWQGDKMKWCYIRREREQRSRKNQFLQALGVLKTKISIVKNPVYSRIDIPRMYQRARKVIGTGHSYSPIVFWKNINVTRELLDWFHSTEPSYKIEKRMRIWLPPSIRVADKQLVLRYILGVSSGAGGLCSILTTKEILGDAVSLTKLATTSAALTTTFKNMRQLGVVATLIWETWYSTRDFVRGTW